MTSANKSVIDVAKLSDQQVCPSKGLADVERYCGEPGECRYRPDGARFSRPQRPLDFLLRTGRRFCASNSVEFSNGRAANNVGGIIGVGNVDHRPRSFGKPLCNHSLVERRFCHPRLCRGGRLLPFSRCSPEHLVRLGPEHDGAADK
jgi:hypothetical protein